MKPEEVTRIRLMFGVTQEKFAHMLGTTTASVNRWENGHVIPSRLYIKEIKNLERNCGSYVCRREEFEES